MSCSCPEKKKFNNSESVQSISICGFDSSLKKAQLSTLFLINKNKTIPCQETTQNKQSNLKKKTLKISHNCKYYYPDRTSQTGSN